MIDKQFAAIGATIGRFLRHGPAAAIKLSIYSAIIGTGVITKHETKLAIM